jgi:hypothetical protein
MDARPVCLIRHACGTAGRAARSRATGVADREGGALAMEAAPPLAELLRAWRDFYALVGAASATLVGLLFVAASIGSNTFREEHRAPLGSFLTPTVAHFTAVLLACMLGCSPSQSWLSFGGALGAGALAGLCYSGRILFLLVVRRRFPRSASCWCCRSTGSSAWRARSAI